MKKSSIRLHRWVTRGVVAREHAALYVQHLDEQMRKNMSRVATAR
jgi:hypothetical protein